MDQYPFQFTLHLCIGELYELMDILEKQPDEMWTDISNDLYVQLGEQIKKEMGDPNETIS
jgi:hypothetical protein